MLRKYLKTCAKINGNGGLWGSGRLHLAPGGHLGAKMTPKIAKRSPKKRQDSQHGAKMGQHGSKMGSQICSKIMKIRLKKWCFFGLLFWFNFGEIWKQKSMRNRIKNRRKHDCKRGGRKLWKCAPRSCENHIFDVSAPPKSIKNRRNIGIENMIF